MSQSDVIASGEEILTEGFNALQQSIHHVKVLQEIASQLNLQGQSDNMIWGEEMLTDGFHAMKKISHLVNVLQEMVRQSKIQESDVIAHGEKMLEDGIKALQKAHLHVKELEEIVHQMTHLEQYARETLEATPAETEEDPVSVNKKRTFSTLQDADQFVNHVLSMGETNSPSCEQSEKRAMHALNTQSCDDHKETQSPLCEPAHTIVIKSFPRRVTQSELYEYCLSYGVCDIDLPIHNDPNHPRYGTIRGFAFIHYETAEQSDRAFHALSTSGLFIGGKKVKAKAFKYNKALRGATLSPNCKPADITECVPAKETDVTPESAPVSAEPLSSMVPETPCSHGVKTIIARNLPSMISEEILCDLFQLYGVVCDVYLPRDKDLNSLQYGTICGFALITYETAEQSARAVRVLTTLGLPICGKEVTVEFAKSDRTVHT
jgi:RNA recognition motif-containing protein